jgi:hypothetical protein
MCKGFWHTLNSRRKITFNNIAETLSLLCPYKRVLYVLACHLPEVNKVEWVSTKTWHVPLNTWQYLHSAVVNIIYVFVQRLFKPHVHMCDTLVCIALVCFLNSWETVKKSEANLRQYEEEQTASLLIWTGPPMNSKQCSYNGIEESFDAHKVTEFVHLLNTHRRV